MIIRCTHIYMDNNYYKFPTAAATGKWRARGHNCTVLNCMVVVPDQQVEGGEARAAAGRLQSVEVVRREALAIRV